MYRRHHSTRYTRLLLLLVLLMLLRLSLHINRARHHATPPPQTVPTQTTPTTP